MISKFNFYVKKVWIFLQFSPFAWNLENVKTAVIAILPISPKTSIVQANDKIDDSTYTRKNVQDSKFIIPCVLILLSIKIH